MPIGDEIRSAGAALLAIDPAAHPEDIANQLNTYLNRFLPQRFRATTAHAIKDGATSPEFLSVLVDTARSNGAPGSEIPSEAMASVIDVRGALDLATFRESYERIADAKAMPKAEPAPEGDFIPTRVTLGVILAVDASLPIERLAQELDALNREHPTRLWTDLVVVLNRGVCHYALQFPGEYEELAGFLPPSDGFKGAIPAYIHIIARPGGRYAFNRMLGVVLPHLGTYSTGLNIGVSVQDIHIDAPQTAVTVCAYQFNLASELRPVPEDTYIKGRFFPPAPLTIKARDGRVLGHLQYVPWQDGAYLRSIGMPLEPFLVKLGNKDYLVTIPRKDSVLSYVLPLTPQGFESLMYRFQKQSNMVVEPPKPPKWTMTKVGDEGTSSPFIARLFAGIIEIRDRALTPENHDRFDKAFIAVRTELDSVRESAALIRNAVKDHRAKLASKEIVKLHGATIEITESIDRLLSKEIEDFLNTAYRVLKDREQLLLKQLGIDIGFLYQKDGTFERGIAALKTTQPELADYFVATRTGWSARLIETRNGLHETWTLDHAQHAADGDALTMTEPQVAGQPISAFVDEILDRLLCFVEEMTAYALAAHMPAPIILREIPLAERRTDYPQRFVIALREGGATPWQLTYHESRFEDT